MSAQKETNDRSGVSGLIFVGCLMIGLAVGLWTGEVAVSLLAGLGIGFIGMGIVRYGARAW